MASSSLALRQHWLPVAIAVAGASAAILFQLGQTNRKKRSILIINPNTTKLMTDALRPVVDRLEFQNTAYDFFTAPSGVGSINNEEDAEVSTVACLPALRPYIDTHDAFLVCCYSAHPLVPALRAEIAKRSSRRISRKPVTGIFEASVAACLQSLSFTDSIDTEFGGKTRFAILTTGPQYEPLLNAAVAALLVGSSDGGDGALAKSSDRFAGTFTTGLNADELHSAPQEEVHRRMQLAATRALERGSRALCLGCAGMVGLDGAVREACVKKLGREEGERVWIIDGVVSGVTFLEGILRSESSG